MGKIAGELSDFCVVTSDNPRTEDPEKIIEQVVEGVKETDCEYVVITNRFLAIEYALDHAQKNDIILLAGKGHETYQVLGTDTIQFDEREIVQKLVVFQIQPYRVILECYRMLLCWKKPFDMTLKESITSTRLQNTILKM